jgi:hypothetical protein
MTPDPILEEVWRIKDELDREAGHDLHSLCENTRRWADSHARTGPVVHSAEELRRLLTQAESSQQEDSNLSLKEEPPIQKKPGET